MKHLQKILISIFMVLIISETLLRILGYRPYEPFDIPHFECSPTDVLDIHDPKLGFRLRPGNYNCLIDDALFFDVTQLPDSSRTTGYIPSQSPENESLLYLYGGSFTWGHGLSDTATFAWKLQQLAPDFHIKNYGISGSSTLQSLILMQMAIDQDQAPDIAILNYASFHDMRNSFNHFWQSMWEEMVHEAQKDNTNDLDIQQFRIPYAKLTKDGTLKIKYIAPAKDIKHVPLRRFSALTNLADIAFHNIGKSRLQNQAISKKIIREMYQLCQKHQIDFAIGQLMNDPDTQSVMEYCQQLGIPVIDLSVNFSDPQFNLMPHDVHPNGKANSIYAQRLFDWLSSKY